MPMPAWVDEAWRALAAAVPVDTHARLVLAEAAATLVEVTPPYPPLPDPGRPGMAQHEAVATARAALHAGVRDSRSGEERLRLARTLRLLRALPA